MGGIDNRAASSGKLGAPTIKVNAITLMGGLDIKVKKPKNLTYNKPPGGFAG